MNATTKMRLTATPDTTSTVPHCYDAKMAAKHMGVSESTIRRAVSGLRGRVLLTFEGDGFVADRPRCAMFAR
jgi:hypothetical protein